MTPIEIHNELLAGRIIKHLERRNFNAHYCATAAEAINLVKSLIPKSSSVSWGGSQTIREMGLTASLIDSGDYKAQILGCLNNFHAQTLTMTAVILKCLATAVAKPMVIASHQYVHAITVMQQFNKLMGVEL